MFKLGQEQANAFETLKDKLTKAPILILPNFTKSFEIECNAFKNWGLITSRKFTKMTLIFLSSFKSAQKEASKNFSYMMTFSLKGKDFVMRIK